MRWYGLIHGHAKLQAAISQGQYSHPQGLFFGGDSAAWSNQTFRRVIDQYLTGATRVVFVDLHTGLGPFGYGEIMVAAPPGSTEHERARTWWGERAKSVDAGEAATSFLTGTTRSALDDLRSSSEVTAATLEFGTVPAVTVLRAMQAENWLHHHGGENHPRAGAIKAQMRWVFYPDTDDWKERVWQQGQEVVEQALAGISDGGG